MLSVSRLKRSNIERDQDEAYTLRNLLAYTGCRYYKVNNRAQYLTDNMPTWQAGLKAHYTMTMAQYNDYSPIAVIFDRSYKSIKSKKVDALRNGDLSYFKITEKIGSATFVVMYDQKVYHEATYTGSDAFKSLPELCNEYLEKLEAPNVR